jgi:hypothetical protein
MYFLFSFMLNPAFLMCSSVGYNVDHDAEREEG